MKAWIRHAHRSAPVLAPGFKACPRTPSVVVRWARSEATS